MAKEFFIGIDGGGTKTIAALANEKGKILKEIEIGPTNPNKIGFQRTILNLRKLLFRISKKASIKLAYLGLAGGLERDKEKREEIKRELQKFFNFPIFVDGDQRIAFRAATDEKDGIVVISGTGSIAVGWKGNKEEICGGWDWLIGDQGSGFWVGKKVLQECVKFLDGRISKFSLKDVIFDHFKIKKDVDFYKICYCEDFVLKVASISKVIDEMAKRGDYFSKSILVKAGEEVSRMAISVIKKLRFEKEKFPVVFVGGMFKSKIFERKVKRSINKVAKKTKFILLKQKPVIGAIKLAIEESTFFPKSFSRYKR